MQETSVVKNTFHLVTRDPIIPRNKVAVSLVHHKCSSYRCDLVDELIILIIFSCEITNISVYSLQGLAAQNKELHIERQSTLQRLYFTFMIDKQNTVHPFNPTSPICDSWHPTKSSKIFF